MHQSLYRHPVVIAVRSTAQYTTIISIMAVQLHHGAGSARISVLFNYLAGTGNVRIHNWCILQ
jgi:hypothetical protein